MRSRKLVTRTTKPVNLAIVLTIYFIVSLVSTTGVDVLMLLTGALMIWATVREFGQGLVATALASLLTLVTHVS